MRRAIGSQEGVEIKEGTNRSGGCRAGAKKLNRRDSLERPVECQAARRAPVSFASGQEAPSTEGRRTAIRMSISRRAPSSAWDTNQSGGH